MTNCFGFDFIHLEAAQDDTTCTASSTTTVTICHLPDRSVQPQPLTGLLTSSHHSYITYICVCACVQDRYVCVCLTWCL